MTENERTTLLQQERPNQWLKFEFNRLREQNPEYSLRSFAKFLQLSSGRLSEYMNNKRQITPTAAKKIASILNYDESLTNSFLNCIALYRKNRKNLKKSLAQIVHHSENQEYNFNLLTIPVVKSQLPLVKNMVHDFKVKLEKELGKELTPENKYQISIQLLKV